MRESLAGAAVPRSCSPGGSGTRAIHAAGRRRAAGGSPAARPPRVLTITPELPTAERPGSMAPVARQIESLRALGTDIEILEVRGARGLKYPRALPRIWRTARRFDLVHAHYGYCGWLARCQLAVPVVVSFMGDDLLGTPDANGRPRVPSRLVAEIDRRFARAVDAVIVKSREMARLVEPVRAHVIPNGVDFQAFRPMDRRQARAMLGWDQAKRYVLFPGSPHLPRKGFPLALAATERAAGQLPVAGTAGIELVALAGVTPERVPLWMNACDALVLTSLWEGSPNVVKEAMACNLPVVSVPVGDVAELLRDGAGGTVCPRDPAALGAALAGVLATDGRSEGRAALARQGLDSESVARRVLDVYREVLDGGAGFGRTRRSTGTRRIVDGQGAS